MQGTLKTAGMTVVLALGAAARGCRMRGTRFRSSSAGCGIDDPTAVHSRR